jgi:hypothetical protein
MKKIFLVIFATLFFSCGKEEFIVPATQESSSLKLLEKKVITGGFDLQPIKPKVDFLFIWDNSGSQRYVDQSYKVELAKALMNISSDFDYRIILSPLLPTDSRQQLHHLGSYSAIFSHNRSDIPNISSGAFGAINPNDRWKPVSEAITTISLMPWIISGSEELGISRASGLLETALMDGIFRQQAYTIMVMISNGDDSGGYVGQDEVFLDPDGTYFPSKITKLKSITQPNNKFKPTLNSKMVRFFSLVPFSSFCRAGIGSRPGTAYRTFSNKVLNDIPASPGVIKSPGGINDSWDFCSPGHFETIFQGINHTIKLEMPYTYHHWPVYLTNNSSEGFKYNPRDFRVFRVNGNDPKKKTFIQPSSSNGWSWSKVKSNGSPGHDTIQELWQCNPYWEDAKGECSFLEKPLNGYFIKLNGNAKVPWPDYIRIETSDPPDYYGYIKINFFPYEDKQYPLRVFKNGIEIPRSQFELISKEIQTKNLKIISPDDFSEDTERPDMQTGYIIKLKSSAVYTNGDTITVRYNPTAVAPGN